MSVRQWLYRNIYLYTPYWKWLRRRIGRRADWFCEVVGCYRHGGNLDCHHTTYAFLWFEWLFPWLMIWLCRAHHNETHHGATLYLKDGRTLKPFARMK